MRIFAFHFEGPICKTASVVKSKKGWEIKQVETLDPVNPLELEKGSNCVSGLDSTEVVLRELELGIASKQAVLKSLPFQVEPLLPFPLEEMVLLPHLEKKDKRSTRALLLAASQSSIEKHLSSCALLAIDPDRISCEPAALFRFAKHFLPEEKNYCTFHLGLERLTYGLVIDKKWKLAFTHPVGLQDFYKALAQDLPEKTTEQLRITAKEFDLFAIQSGRFPVLSAFIQQLQKDLDRISTFIAKKCPEGELCKFFFTGDLESASNWRDFLERHLGPSLFLTDIPPEHLSHAIPIGLCLDSAHPEGFDFRQGPFVSPIKRKQKIRRTIAFIVSCVLLNGLTWFSGSHYFSERESQLSSRLHAYINAYGNGFKPSQQNFKANLSDWDTALSQYKKPFPFQSTAPKVSDVLAWISSHPLLKHSEKPKEDRIEIKRVNYQLMKYPKLSETNDSYLAKVDLEFSSPSPRLAREFHDALLAGDELVNPKGEMTWIVNQNTYLTSFFLKPQKQLSSL